MNNKDSVGRDDTYIGVVKVVEGPQPKVKTSVVHSKIYFDKKMYHHQF